jgi:predicted metal-dependent enzyme (double-stranded beta helix superfamily)
MKNPLLIAAGYMLTGTQALVDLVDGAVVASDVQSITDQITRNLCRLIRRGGVELPAAVTEPNGEHYARRLVHRDADRGYSIIAMTWGPGQGTPIHDHAGMWCVEGVWAGRIEVEQYDLVEDAGQRCCFVKQGLTEAGVGSAGCLIPPYEYHSIRNASEADSAVSLHIYGGDMTACNVYEPLGEGRFERVLKPLSLDA